MSKLKATKPKPPPRTARLAVASFVLGLFGLTCLGVLAGIPAIICGRISRRRLESPGAVQEGAGMARAGTILGYLSIATTILQIIFYAIASPAYSTFNERGNTEKQLANARQIAFAIQSLASKGATTGDKSLGFPADSGITSGAALKALLINERFLTAREAESLHFENFLIGNVSAADPANTTLIRSNPSQLHLLQIIVRKGGESFIVQPYQTFVTKDPPRSPPYLAPLP